MGLPGELGRAGEMLGVISAYQWGRYWKGMKTIVHRVQNPHSQELALFQTCSKATKSTGGLVFSSGKWG